MPPPIKAEDVPIKAEDVSYTALPYPIGSEVRLPPPDGRVATVIGYRSESEERVVQFDDGMRRSVEIIGLQLVRMPPPKPELPAEPGPQFRSAPSPDGKDRARKGPALIVQGDFTPEMFGGPNRSQEDVILHGGPYDGHEQRITRGTKEHSLPMPHPDPGPGRPDIIPAVYRRTGRRDADGLAIFAHRVEPEPAATVA